VGRVDAIVYPVILVAGGRRAHGGLCAVCETFGKGALAAFAANYRDNGRGTSGAVFAHVNRNLEGFLMRNSVVLLLALCGCTQIDTGNIGVEATLGQVKKEEALPGLYFTMLKTMHEISAKEIAMPLENLRPKSKDNLTMADFDVDIYYKIDPSRAADIMIRYAGDITEAKNGDEIVGHGFVYRNAREATYGVASGFNGSDMNPKRPEIAEEIRKKLQAELDRTTGKDWFTVTNVNIRNIVTDPQIEAAIRSAAQTQFEVSRKQQELDLAKAEAARLRVESEGKAAANRIIADSLTQSLLRLREIEMQAAFASGGTHTVLLGGATPLIQVK
jgi:regulator of protease activity HflC (stomatin/prohibitin superfamily)